MDGRNWNWKYWNTVVDVSPFLLCESTGDSEANSDLNMPSISTADNMDVTTYEVDDAQSCCSNFSGSFRDYNHHDQDQEHAQCPKKKSDQEKCPKKKDREYAAQSSKKKEHEHASYDGYKPNYRDSIDDDDDDDDEDDGAVDQDWTCGKMGFVVSKQKRNTNKSKASTAEPGKEGEKDKLFWDTCLGS